MRVVGRDEHDVEIAGERTVLERVIEQEQLRSELLFGGKTGRITIFANNDRDAELARKQQRLITKFVRRSGWINHTNAARIASVAAREHAIANAALREQLAEQNDERRLAGAAHGNVADADDGSAEAARG